MGVVQCIDRLPPRQREAVRLRYVDGLTEPDIAARMNVCERRVRQLFFAARKRLAPEGVKLPRPVHGRHKTPLPASQFCETTGSSGLDLDDL